jgi:hypothetical protein
MALRIRVKKYSCKLVNRVPVVLSLHILLLILQVVPAAAADHAHLGLSPHPTVLPQL